MSLSLSFQTMEKQRICKICDKRFANGKAMGGHMRSHLAKLPIPPKPQQQQQQENSPFTTDSTQPPPSPLDFHHRNNNNSMQSHRSLNQQELSDVMEANSDRESDTDSQPKNPTRRRSKRRRKTLVPPVLLEQHETLSSVSDSAFPEEDVAMCLLRLSRDKWSNAKGKEKVPQQQKVDETVVIYDDDDVEEDDDYAPCKIRKRTQDQTKFRCETCKKAFQSYQALGGHRASHKKTKNNHQFNEDEDEDLEEEEGNFVVDQRVFECPFCNKVFESGQALGGHKKVHLSNLGNSNANAKSNPARFIDLNLPAPIDDDDEVVFSAVSNAE